MSQWKLRQQEVPSSKIEKVVEGEPLKLSHGQQRLWLLQQLHPENPFYNYSEAYRFHGKLNFENLYKSLQTIYDSHDILRTTYKIVDGLPVAKVGPKEKLHIGEYELNSESENQQLIDQTLLVDSSRPFDLLNGPVIRFSLYKLTSEKYILLLNLHHIATDKWSMGIFRNQLAENYKALCAGVDTKVNSLDIQYHDYATWQRNKAVDQKQKDYWLKKLEGEIPILELPKDHKRPILASYKGAFKKQSFPTSLSKSVLDLSAKLEATPYVLLLSVYYVLLYRYTNQKDILIGSPISNRDHKSLEDLIGFFNDTVVLRTKFDENTSFLDLVKIVRKTTLEAFANKGVAFEDLVKTIQPDRAANMNPFFNVMFLYHSVPKSPDFGSDLEFTQEVFDTKVAKFDLTLYIAEENNSLSSIFEYASDLFNEVTIERLQEHFSLLLQGIVENPNEKISEIPMLTSFEKEVFLQKESNLLTVEIPKKGIHDIITEIAKNNFNKKAVTFGSESITYQELITRSNLVAINILEITRGKNEIIGLCMQRSLDMIVGLLGILKAGCAYLPLDPSYPKGRIDFMLADANVSVTVSNTSTISELTGFGSKVLDINKVVTNTEDFEIELPLVNSVDTAYLIYTSGSSGKPKGVLISHGNIINSTLGRKEFYDTNPAAFLLMSSISFDSSKAGIFWTLCTGGNLVISEKRLEQDLAKLTEVIKSNEVSHTLMLPSLYSMLLDHADLNKLKGLKTVIVAGESCAANLCTKHFEKLPNTILYNEYGPTEATVWCIAHKVDKNNINPIIPIGRPVSGANIYILNPELHLVPYGAIGEIFVGGPGLSGAYLNRPELLDAVYLPNPFNEISDSKLYKTGDLGRYNSEGDIEFLGRVDNQVKIRGFRIELEEIQNAFIKNEDVIDAVIIVEEIPENAQKRLIAFIESTKTYNEKLLRHNLSLSLPNYMIPSSIIVLDSLPHLPNGKIDKKTLANIKHTDFEKELLENDLPKNENEIKLKKIWETVLSISPIGIHDNFFEIGGDSISSIQIIAKSRADGIHLKANQIFEHQTIAQLAMFTNKKTMEIEDESLIEGDIVLTPIQHWFFKVQKNNPNYWNQIVSVSGINATSMEHIKAVFLRLIGHHDALRLSFDEVRDEWKASVIKFDDLDPFFYIDISMVSEKYSQQETITQKLISIQKNVELSKGNLFQGVYFNCGATQENKFMMIAHHLVIDMVSWNIIFGDFIQAIEQVKADEKISFKKKTESIKQWGEIVNSKAQSPEVLNELEFWQNQCIETERFPSDFKVENSIYLESTIDVYQRIIHRENMGDLLKNVNETYNTKTEDLLITALFKTVTDWTSSTNLVLGLEHNGRRSANLDIDISNTVGWFTSFFPILLSKSKSNDIGALMTSIKEKLRSIPNNGVGFGLLKYLSGEDYFRTSDGEAQVIFNYLGVQNNVSDNSNLVFEQLSNYSRDPRSERTYGIEINAFIKNEKLHVNWSYSSELYKESTINTLALNFENNLQELFDHCLNNEGNYTPSDFPEANLNQDDLDNLMKQFE